MYTKRIIRTLSALSLLFGVAVAPAATAAGVADFYKDKTVTIIVGFGAGGSYGIYARLLSNAFAKYIPGNPTVTPQYMPGGGSRKAINYLYNVAPRNGAVLGMGIPQLAFNQLIFPKGIKFDMRNFNIIGRLTDGNVIFMLRSDSPGGGSLAGAKRIQVVIGAAAKALTPT